MGERRRERERAKRDDDDSVTPCVVADSRRLRPLRRSHLSPLRLFSPPRDLSLHHTRGRQHTVARACISDTHGLSPSLLTTLLHPPTSSADHPLFRSFSLSHDNQAVSSIGINAPTAAKLLAPHIHMLTHVPMYPIRGSNSDGVVCIDRRGVGDGTRDTSLGRGREGQTKVGVRSPLVPPGPLSLLRGTLSFLSLHRASCAFPLFPHDSLWPANLSFAPYVPFHLLQLILRFLA